MWLSQHLWQLPSDGSDALWYSCPGTLREGSRCGCPGYWKSWHPCHGKKCSCYLQGVSGFWLKALNCQPQRKHCVFALLLSFAQVINAHSTIVEALAGMACSLQGLTIGTEAEEEKLPYRPILTFCLLPSGPTGPIN